jgi:tRNA_anti-like
MFTPRLFICCGFLCLSTVPLLGQAVNLADAEVQRCQEKIASVKRDVFGKYDDLLGELQLTFQKAGDLEGALAVRAEKDRLKTEQSLNDGDLVDEPKALRALQTQFLGKEQELVGQLVREALPKLIEFKKSLTVAGKLDEALAARTAIENLQNNMPVIRPQAGTVTPAEAIILAYSGDRPRADRIYKGQKITIHGVIGGYRQDPDDAKSFLIYLSGGQGGGWVQCSFTSPDYRFREETSNFGATSLVITSRNSENSVKVQKGQPMDIRGMCQGLDEVVRLNRCELPK